MGASQQKSFGDQMQAVAVQLRIKKLKTIINQVQKPEVRCPKPHRELKVGERCICGERKKS